jgi:hypothetical protein
MMLRRLKLTMALSASLVATVALVGACKPSSKQGMVETGTGSGTGTGTATGALPGGSGAVVPGGGLPPDDGSVEAGFTGFLTANDVVPQAAVPAPDKAGLTEVINGFRDVFYMKNPRKTFDANDCNDAAFDASSFKATRTTLVFEVDTPDFSACLNTAAQTDPQVKLTYTAAHIRYLDKTTCEGVDLTPLNGKPPSQITDADTAICDQAKSANQLRNAVLDYAFNVVAGTASLSVTAKSVVSTMTADGKACHGVNDGTGWVYDPCRYIVRTTYTFGAEQGDVTKLKALYGDTYLLADGEGLRGLAPGPFYSAGKFHVTYGQWIGEMVYAGGNQPPQWTLKMGADTATGAFTGQTTD